MYSPKSWSSKLAVFGSIGRVGDFGLSEFKAFTICNAGEVSLFVTVPFWIAFVVVAPKTTSELL